MGGVLSFSKQTWKSSGSEWARRRIRNEHDVLLLSCWALIEECMIRVIEA